MADRQSPLKKNQRVPLTITGMTAEGSGVGHCEGMAVFVPETAVGDVLEAQIVKVQKQYAFGILRELHTPSPDRIAPDCPHFHRCGGCVFRHISYEAECRIKAQIVSDAFARIGHLTPRETLPILGAEQLDGCRNKAQYPCGAHPETGALCFGFYAARSHRLVPLTDCRLQPPVFGEILSRCKDLLYGVPPYDEQSGKGILRHIFLRRGYHSGEVMVCFVVAKNITDTLKKVGDTLIREFPEIVSVMQNINPGRTNVILGDRTSCLCGSAVLRDTLCGVPVSLSPQSFYQVNTAQAERLFAEAKRLAAPLSHELLLDLYCGAGAIGLSMSDAAGRIIGVETVPQAVEDAKANAKRAGIANAEFFCGDAGEIAAQLAADALSPDLIVLDPPRKGCDNVTLDACLKMFPERIVMISCNPATAARDAAYLCGNGFSLEALRPVDLFPRTGHVECVVLMSRNEN